jgi:hypothetical protein
MVNIIKANSYSYTVRYWGGCSVGGHEEMTYCKVLCDSILNIYIYICCILPSDLLPCEGIEIYSEWQGVEAKLENYVIYEERKTDRPNTYLIFDHDTEHAHFTGVLNLTVRPASFLKTLHTNYPMTWHHIWVEQRTLLIMRLMRCLLIVTVIYTLLIIIPMWMAIYLSSKVLP